MMRNQLRIAPDDRMKNSRLYNRLVLIVFAGFLPLALKAQAIDLSGEPAFAPRQGSFTESQIPLSMKFISADQIIIASDLYDRCNDERNKNIYVILSINPLTGDVTSRRKIPAPPGSFDLILDTKLRPLLVSQSSIQVLIPNSLDTAQTISLDTTRSADARGSDDKEHGDCWEINLRTSVTPDSKHIMVAVTKRLTRTTNLYQVDGETLSVTQKSITGYLPNFQVGFEGLYEQSPRRQWDWTNGKDSMQVCVSCDFLDVLSANSIVTTFDTRVSVQNGTSIVWSTRFSGMRDSFDSDQNGNRFAILAATGGGLFDSDLRETLFVFDAPLRKVRRIRISSVKQSGPVQGGGRSALALSENGLRIAVFVKGRLTVISQP